MRKSFNRREKIGEKHPVPTPGVGMRPKIKLESVLLEPKGLEPRKRIRKSLSATGRYS
jgi:hypothetical protein